MEELEHTCFTTCLGATGELTALDGASILKYGSVDAVAEINRLRDQGWRLSDVFVEDEAGSSGSAGAIETVTTYHFDRSFPR